MKKPHTRRGRLVPALVAGGLVAGLATGGRLRGLRPPGHARSRAQPRYDVNDVYAFPAATPGRTVLVLGTSSPITPAKTPSFTFGTKDQELYQIKVDNTGDARRRPRLPDHVHRQGRTPESDAARPGQAELSRHRRTRWSTGKKTSPARSTRCSARRAGSSSSPARATIRSSSISSSSSASFPIASRSTGPLSQLPARRPRARSAPAGQARRLRPRLQRHGDRHRAADVDARRRSASIRRSSACGERPAARAATRRPSLLNSTMLKEHIHMTWKTDIRALARRARAWRGDRGLRRHDESAIGPMQIAGAEPRQGATQRRQSTTKTTTIRATTTRLRSDRLPRQSARQRSDDRRRRITRLQQDAAVQHGDVPSADRGVRHRRRGPAGRRSRQPLGSVLYPGHARRRSVEGSEHRGLAVVGARERMGRSQADGRRRRHRLDRDFQHAS